MYSLNGESRKRRRASTVSTAPTISDTDDSETIVIDGALPERPVPATQNPTHKFIVGVDYGTTYSSVSYIKFNAASPPTTLRGEQIKSVCNWPNPSNLWRNPDVPSESWYLDDEFHWGYNARQEIKGIQNGSLDSRNRIIQFAKLLLDEGKQGEHGPRNELRRTLTKHRKTEKDVIKDVIREILKHSKTELERKEELTENSEVELVFCVPAGWKAKALRTMQEILLEVTAEIKFGILSPLFILNEPEAAAAYMLEALPGCENLKEGDVFIVCDAGGGTVDTITYRVRRERPFRLEEVVAPAGSNCGSSYVNQALKREAIKRIKGTEYEALKGPSFEYIIEHDIMEHFEYSVKRNFNPEYEPDGNESIVVHGLTEDSRKGFGNSTLYVPRKKVLRFFDHSLKGISRLIQQQISGAKEIGLLVSNILLVGGFSTSSVLLNHIQRAFPMLTILDTPGDMAIAVSHGAVFRTLNKEDGPSRKLQSNFGFLQIEEYNNKLHPAAIPIHNPLDNKKYVYDILDWVIKKPFKSLNYQVFEMNEKLEIVQRIYVSDEDNVYDHKQLQDRCNKSAEIFGRLVVDLQEVKDEGLLGIKSGPTEDFYEIHYELSMEVDGRNLTVKLFCPPGGKCRGQKQLCIAAAFIPGTE